MSIPNKRRNSCRVFVLSVEVSVYKFMGCITESLTVRNTEHGVLVGKIGFSAEDVRLRKVATFVF